MMNYNVVANGDIFEVVETASGFVIGGYKDQQEAKAKARFLNFGGGFDGRTPPFMMERIVIKHNSF